MNKNQISLRHQCDSNSGDLPSIVPIIDDNDNNDGGLSVTDSSLNMNADSINNGFHYAAVNLHDIGNPIEFNALTLANSDVASIYFVISSQASSQGQVSDQVQSSVGLCDLVHYANVFASNNNDDLVLTQFVQMECWH